jgi:hypothetical protein
LTPTQDAPDTLNTGLPIGWTGSESFGGLSCLSRLVGWMITALSTLFGAALWFDALSGVVKLRGVGPSPGGKTSA